MVDDFEPDTSEGLDLQRVLGVVRRRHLHFLIPLLFGWAAIWGASWIIPPRYRSTTLILVEQPTMPKDYVTPNVNDDLQERLQSITQQILSRTRLLHIIEQSKLFAGDHAEQSPEAEVESMRKNIQIDLVQDSRNQISAFNLSYISADPHTAQQVTSELTQMFINENLEVRQKASRGTTEFLEAQLETAQASLAKQEDKIREFKAQHVGEMPGQLASNLQVLSGVQSQLQNEEDALNTTKQQHVYLQSLADQYRAMEGISKGADGSEVGIAALDLELEHLRAQLADLSTRYTDTHPDVGRLKGQIAKTQKMRDDFVANLKKQQASPEKDDATAVPVTDGPDSTQSSLLVQVQGQLRSNQVEIANREHAIAALKAKVEQYQARLNEEPVREQQLADLTRGYDQSKANYDELLKKKNDSAMATSMELLQRGERFRILDPPSFPQKPEFPNRLKFCGMGVAAGLALGVVVVGVFEFRDDRLYEAKQIRQIVEKVLSTGVTAEIPVIMSPFDEKNGRRKSWLGWATAVLVFSTILVGSAVSYLHR